MIYQNTKRKKEKKKKRKHLNKLSSPTSQSQPQFETSIASKEKKVKSFCAVPAMSAMTKLIFVQLFGTENFLAKANKGQLV